MLIHLGQQLHRLLRQRRGQLLLTLLAALWLALPLSATTSVHVAQIDTIAAQQADNHCAHHTQANTDAETSTHSGHHGSDHDCHCAQACHASPVAIVATSLNLPPPTHTAQPFERSPLFATTSQPPLYRPPITLAA